MNPSPIISVIEFLRLTLLPQPSVNTEFVSPLPPQYQAPPDLPRPPFTFPLPPTNPGYNDRPINPFFPPPAQPIDPNDRNQNGIPDDIDELLG
jgi:hypothetical protein